MLSNPARSARTACRAALRAELLLKQKWKYRTGCSREAALPRVALVLPVDAASGARLELRRVRENALVNASSFSSARRIVTGQHAPSARREQVHAPRRCAGD